MGDVQLRTRVVCGWETCKDKEANSIHHSSCSNVGATHCYSPTHINSQQYPPYSRFSPPCASLMIIRYPCCSVSPLSVPASLMVVRFKRCLVSSFVRKYASQQIVIRLLPRSIGVHCVISPKRIWDISRKRASELAMESLRDRREVSMLKGPVQKQHG
jgi:hypothetical protein